MSEWRRHEFDIMAERWVQDHQRDPWRRRAVAEGYRARSAFKLKQIQTRFEIMEVGDVILDVGCHPGGWTQVAVEEVGEQVFVIGVDLESSKPVDGAHLLVGDITHPQTQDRILDLLDGKQINAVISDISPEITGRWEMDQAIAIDLVAKVFDFALPLLRPGGKFITKLFQGVGVDELIKSVKQHFSKVKRFSPEASRNSSSEVYLICLNHKPWLADSGGPDITGEMEVAFNDDEEEEEIQTVATGFRVIRRNTESE